MDEMVLRSLAQVLADEEIPAEIGSLFTVGTPTEQQMELLRRRGILLDESVTAEELFTWPVQAASNQTHSKSMWLDVSTLDVFREQATVGRGVPYLRDHNTGQGTTGRVYHAALVEDGEVGPRQLDEGAVPTFRDLFRDPVPLVRLYEQVFMALQGTPDEQAHITKLRAGVQASNSVGFALYGALEPGSYIQCDACKVDLFRVDYETCPHFPGVEYEVVLGEENSDDPDTVVALATARIVKARQRELSGVYMGAVPDSFTERGRNLHDAGLMSLRQARRVEDMYQLSRGAIVGDRRTYSIPAATDADGSDKPKPRPTRAAYEGDESMEKEKLLARLRDLVGDKADLWADLELKGVEDDPLKALVGLLLSEQERLTGELDEANAAREALRKRIAERIGAEDGETLDDALVRVEKSVAVAGKVRERLLDDYVKQSTRAGLPVQKEEAQKLAAGWDLETIEAQTKRLKTMADQNLSPGSVGEGPLHDRHGESNGKADADAVRRSRRMRGV